MLGGARLRNVAPGGGVQAESHRSTLRRSSSPQLGCAESGRQRDVLLRYVGIWNERSWGSVDYVVSLRSALDEAGLGSTRIVVPDGGGCEEVTEAASANISLCYST